MHHQDISGGGCGKGVLHRRISTGDPNPSESRRRPRTERNAALTSEFPNRGTSNTRPSCAGLPERLSHVLVCLDRRKLVTALVNQPFQVTLRCSACTHPPSSRLAPAALRPQFLLTKCILDFQVPPRSVPDAPAHVGQLASMHHDEPHHRSFYHP